MESGRRTMRLAALTAALFLVALVFGARYVGVVAASFVLLGTAAAVATIWSWNDEGRPAGPWIVGGVALATVAVLVVLAVGAARYT